jgi:hypothetical protein
MEEEDPWRRRGLAAVHISSENNGGGHFAVAHLG